MTTSASNSDAHKSATAVCGEGKVVVGAGGAAINGKGAVILTAFYPNPGLTEVTAEASESVVYGANWEVSAFADLRPSVPLRRVDARHQRAAPAEWVRVGGLSFHDVGHRRRGGDLPRQRPDADPIDARAGPVEERGCLQCRDPKVSRGWCRTEERHVA